MHAVICDELSITFLDVHFILPRGHNFRTEYSRLGEVRSILPRGVNVMALTATATKTLRKDVIDLLSMDSPFLVSVLLTKVT